MMTKFKIYKKSREQGNLTGRPWLMDLPIGHQYSGNGYVTLTAQGLCFDNGADALAYIDYRLGPRWPYRRVDLAVTS